ncbi:type-I secretion protein [Salmonella enterica subsp. arizonae]|uniref:Type-I secretion protein n=1 Tax=Salmonella enterica subsp. arizonae TaxID=59203 RepID=A0A379T442_SALER|nr:type-I secretion protein [Salmonella enterica subsp. arizonae]
MLKTHQPVMTIKKSNESKVIDARILAKIQAFYLYGHKPQKLL